MRLLRYFALCLVYPGCCRYEFFSVFCGNEISGLCYRFHCQICRIRPVIGNMPLFIQGLGYLHSSFGAPAQFVCPCLLQRGCCKRRRGGFFKLPLGHPCHTVGGFFQIELNFFRFYPVADFNFLAFSLRKLYLKFLYIHFFHFCEYLPVFLRFKSQYFPFPFHYQPDGHALDPSRRQAFAHFPPQEW